VFYVDIKMLPKYIGEEFSREKTSTKGRAVWRKRSERAYLKQIQL
jgi:hypothetical protein